MIFPNVRIQWISDLKGYGLIATEDIPMGTITFVQDGLDIVIPSVELDSIDPILREYVEKYSYEDYLGNRIISWDLGKYMNHDDNANTLTTGYGFEVAIRDIKKGEEITDDYRIFSTHHDTTFKIPPGEVEEIIPWPEHLLEQWNKKTQEALKLISSIEQPLIGFIAQKIIKEVETANKIGTYRSVSESLPLRYKKHMKSLVHKS
jgi:SET domain-containing protein